MVVAGDQELEPGLPLDGRLLELATAAASETSGSDCWERV